MLRNKNKIAMSSLAVFFGALLTGVLATSSTAYADKPLRVGSKKFTENVILGEIATLMVRNAGFTATHTRELGGTRILWSALIKGDIDIYPDYTGTITHEIFANRSFKQNSEIHKALAEHGIRMTRPIGFNNTYAIGVPQKVADKFNLQKISDLKLHPQLRMGFSNEFMERNDGWPGLKRRYGLDHKNVTGLDHDLAYRAIDSGSLDVMDLYATDAEIQYYNIKALEDDQNYFPKYDAVYLYRIEAAVENEGLEDALFAIEGLIDADQMSALNAQSKFQKDPARKVAAEFLKQELTLSIKVENRNFLKELRTHTYNHLYLVLISLFAAIIFAVPVGILAAKVKSFGQLTLGIVSVVQTIPSLALLVFMIPLLGIGSTPAIVALFLYSLLPIVRNTYQGIINVDSGLQEAALAIGLPPSWRLLKIELPLAAGSILAGIKTAAVINIGTATLGALIGAGGYGQPILTGIRLDDFQLILMGAVPAALMALLAQGMFDLAERYFFSGALKQ